MTRDSLLTLARDRGYKVSERVFDVKQMLEWVKSGEAALSGTAAVLAGVGTLIYRGTEHRVAGGDVGPLTRALARAAGGDSTGRRAGPSRLARAGVSALRRASGAGAAPRTSRSPWRLVFLALLVVLVIEVVVILVVFVVVPVLVLVFILFRILFRLGARPALPAPR